MKKNELVVDVQTVTETFLLPFGTEYMRQKYNWSPIYTELAMKEYRRFIYLACIAKESVTPSLDIDEVWHTHILHTRSYREFSKALGKVIHHDPGMPFDRGDFQGQYRRTLSFYTEIFDEEPPVAVWPRPLQLQTKSVLAEALDLYTSNK